MKNWNNPKNLQGFKQIAVTSEVYSNMRVAVDNLNKVGLKTSEGIPAEITIKGFIEAAVNEF